MIDAIVNNRNRIMACCVYLTGEYGYNNICLGVPVKIGSRGIEEIELIKLNDEEAASFEKSAHDVKEQITKLKL